MKILLLSDTHGYIDDAILKYCNQADEIWHAGDIGSGRIPEKLSSIKPFRAVYGNIDGQNIRQEFPEILHFNSQGVQVMMIHIGGYPKVWPAKVLHEIRQYKPALFICGHSHILKVMRDHENGNMLCINPGAAGKSGFHQQRTMVRFELHDGNISELDVIDLGKR